MIVPHPHSVRDTESTSHLDSDFNDETVSDDDGHDGTRSDRRAAASNALATSGSLQAQRTDSHSNGEPGGGQQSIVDDNSLPHGGQIHLESPKISARDSTLSIVAGETGVEMERDVGGASAPPLPNTSDTQDTSNRTSHYDGVPLSSQNRPMSRVESQDGGRGQAGITDSVLMQAGVEHDRAEDTGVGAVGDIESSPRAEEGSGKGQGSRDVTLVWGNPSPGAPILNVLERDNL